MAERTSGARAALSIAGVYQRLQDLLGSRRFQRRLITEQVAAAPGMRLLDIGCGTGAVVEHVPRDVAYHGFDPSAGYIAAAQQRWGDRGRFWCAGVDDPVPADIGRFERATAIGVLHHLDDATAVKLAARAAAALTADGLLVTYDPAITAATSRLARFVIARDRGMHVRRPDAYAALLAAHFAEVEIVTVAGHLRIPYTGCILTARQPR
jgi:cyclopropane fatty-acyl-phospholipid synthase-like methyltransferase